jgi:hypothetical protein
VKYLIAILIAAMGAAAANPDAIYRCEVLNVSQLETNGKLVKNDWARTLDNLDEVIIFDSASGLLRYQGETGSYEFQVLEAGSSANAMKAVRVFKGPASTVMELIRINTFSTGEFIYVDGDLVRTGKCEAL